jgi:hypothetical protein
MNISSRFLFAPSAKRTNDLMNISSRFLFAPSAKRTNDLMNIFKSLSVCTVSNEKAQR